MGYREKSILPLGNFDSLTKLERVATFHVATYKGKRKWPTCAYDLQQKIKSK